MTTDLGEACAAIARAVADSLDLGEVIGRVAAAARLVVPFDAMGVWHAKAPDDPLSLVAGPGASARVAPADHPLRRADHSPKLWPAADSLPACIADAPIELDRAFMGDRIVIDLSFRSALILGLGGGERSLGILWFLKRDAGAYSRAHASALQPVVDLTTLAVEHSQLLILSDERRRKREALEALLPTLAARSTCKPCSPRSPRSSRASSPTTI